MRSKETEADYRYFREPDLLPIKLTEEQIKEILRGLPELPLERKMRFIEEYHLPERDAEVLTSERSLADYYQGALEAYQGESKQVANWVINEVLGMINEQGLAPDELSLTPGRLAAVLSMIDDGTINSSTAKDLIRMVEAEDEDPLEIVEAKGLAQLTDSSQIRALCEQIIEENPEQAAQYQAGKQSLIGWFIGQAMSASGGKADPQAVREIFQQLLE
jgi:aspartyl-tRNA(Asn)/glutamyl-tRNA(Gln) amidotransferase subunit B